jgi:hypothetical protein
MTTTTAALFCIVALLPAGTLYAARILLHNVDAGLQWHLRWATRHQRAAVDAAAHDLDALRLRAAER